MSDKSKPAPVRSASPISIPELPSDSGSWAWSRTQVLHDDTEYVQAHAGFLDARAAQAGALHDLVAARMRIMRLMAELAALPETCRRVEEHKLRLLTLKNEVEATEAAIILAEARSRFAQATGGVKPAAPQTNDGSLTTDEIEELLQSLPEISPETLQTLSLMLKGRLKEKRG